MIQEHKNYLTRLDPPSPGSITVFEKGEKRCCLGRLCTLGYFLLFVLLLLPLKPHNFFVLQYLFPGLNNYLFMDSLSMNLSNRFSNLLLLPLEASFRTPWPPVLTLTFMCLKLISILVLSRTPSLLYCRILRTRASRAAYPSPLGFFKP